MSRLILFDDGAPDRAEALSEQLRAHHENTADALVMADRYTGASLMAYELFRLMGDDAPVVTSAASRLGDRESAYDEWSARWPETDPANPRWIGTTVHLVGGGERKWTNAFRFDRFQRTSEAHLLSVGFGYRGPVEERDDH